MTQPDPDPNAVDRERRAIYGVEVLRNRAIPTGDGVELAADVYLPRDAPPGPALVTLLPYHKDGIAGITSWDANHYFASRGYACVMVDFRGTGASGGRPLPPFHPDEGRDGVTAVQWAARQSWCDGVVGMSGVSYGATTTLRTAALRPPALAAIAPVMGFVDPERDFVHPAGRRGCLASVGVWGLTTLAQHLTPPLHQDPAGTWHRRWRDRLEHSEPYIVDLLRHGPGNPVWRARAIDASRIRVPAFCVAGWRDLSCDAIVGAYEQVRGPKKLLVGPWMHTLPDESPFEAVDFLSLALDWWDRWLRGEANGADEGPPVSVYLQGQGGWRGLPAWPPPAERSKRMSAGADASLSSATPALAGVAERSIDPTVGIGGGLWSVPTRGFGLPRDQHDDDARALAFTSAPLDEPLEICGRPRASVTVPRGAGATRTLVVKLAHVARNGRSTLITSGTAALPATAPESSGGRRESAHVVEMIPTAYALPAGDRLRLVVAGADFPRLWPDPVGEGLAVRCGGASTHVDLPVVEASSLDAAELPLRDGARPALPLVLRADPLYTVTHDAMTDGVTVTVGDHLLMKTPHDDGTLDMNGHVAASIAVGHAEAAHVKGRATTRAETAHGEYVVRAELLVTAETAVISGAVTLEGQQVFSRRWTL